MFGKDALAYTIGTSTLGLAGFLDLGALISVFVPVVLSLTGLLFFGYLIMGGLKYISAGGDDKAIGEAKKILTNAILGFLLVFAAFWLVRIVESVLHIDITGL